MGPAVADQVVATRSALGALMDRAVGSSVVCQGPRVVLAAVVLAPVVAWTATEVDTRVHWPVSSVGIIAVPRRTRVPRASQP